MIPLEEIPRSGVLLVTVNFKDYKDSYQNDARRKLEKLPEIVEREKLDIELIPLGYWLGRTIIDKVTRATGGSYKYGFSNMTPEKFGRLSEIIEKMKKDLNWWEDVEILIGNRVSIDGIG